MPRPFQPTCHTCTASAVIWPYSLFKRFQKRQSDATHREQGRVPAAFSLSQRISRSMSIFVRRLFTGLGLSFALGLLAAPVAHAQMGGGGGQSGQGDADKAADRDKKDAEWGDKDLHLKSVHAEGPCPYVKVLYDAARYHEFKDNKISASSAVWTGEIE